MSGATDRFAEGLYPMFLEGPLQLRNQRAFDANLRIPPMELVLRVAGPFARESSRAGKADLAVDNEDTPVRPSVCPIDPPRKGRMIIGELAPSLLHHFDVGVIEAPPG